MYSIEKLPIVYFGFVCSTLFLECKRNSRLFFLHYLRRKSYFLRLHEKKGLLSLCCPFVAFLLSASTLQALYHNKPWECYTDLTSAWRRVFLSGHQSRDPVVGKSQPWRKCTTLWHADACDFLALFFSLFFSLPPPLCFPPRPQGST